MLSSGSAVGVGALQAMSSQTSIASSYSNERPPPGLGGGAAAGLEVEYDPASGSFFTADYKKHDDLKQMLDSNKDSLKLEAMKRIIGMVAKGKDASDLFPAVVKNVVSKNIEVKKLVYVYLVRYAEEQQDLALLSISTFQRALKDPNQLIRAGALRVLSSIRVSMIVPIVMLAIRESASDMSPYVRKTAAHAIPKLFSLDVEQKDELITVIEKLLSDRTTLVVGSAVMAFEEVCPERVDLIHKNYRKLCNLLVDVDEWGQIIIINMLTRYARTQFVDPNRDDFEEDEVDAIKPFYDETSSDEEGSDVEENGASKASNSTKSPKKLVHQLDADHRLLLRQTKPLLQSRNASVVMTVAQLYHHVAPRNEVALVAKALIRLLRSHKEVQSVVLTSIASMSTQRKSIFEIYMKSFFVRTSDATHIKLLKLEILTNLATEASISVILREFQTYISSNDKDFVAATIQAIGRCAASIKEVTETCLGGLVHLLSNRDEYVVAESVVVIKQLLQTQAADHFEIISQMAKLLDFIAVPAARAAILWLIGEYNEKVPKIAPDVLRKLAKTFVDEENIVKLQVLNLAVKLFLTNPTQTELLCQYVFNLARYDQNYDIRDRARFLKQFVFPSGGQTNVLTRNAKQIFLAAKPAPQLVSKYQGREQFQLGSLSHYLNVRATGYHDIPDFPDVASDSTVRNVESPTAAASDAISPEDRYVSTGETAPSKPISSKNKVDSKKKRSFYSDSDKSSSEYQSSDSSSDVEEATDDEVKTKPAAVVNTKKTKEMSSSEPESSSDSGEDSPSSSSDDGSSGTSSSGSEESSEEEESSSKTFEKAKKMANSLQPNQNGTPKKSSEKSNLDLLLELDDISPVGPVMTPSMGGFLTPGNNHGFTHGLGQQRIDLVGPTFIPLNTLELINKNSGNGLSVRYRFTRAPHLFSASMVSIELAIANGLEHDLNDVRLDVPAGSIQIKEFASIATLAVGSVAQALIGIDFNDSTQPINFAFAAASFSSAKATLKPPVGELVRSVVMSELVFLEERAKLRGMNEHSAQLQLADSDKRALQKRIFEYANVAPIPSSDPTHRLNFAGQTFASKSLVLFTIDFADESSSVVSLNVACEKMVIGSMLLTELRAFLLNV